MTGPWDIDDEGHDPDYGVFGDAGMERPIPKTDPRRDAQAKRQREQREREQRTSREFNSHMINLFNKRGS